MIDAWGAWLLLVGLVIGVAVTAVLLVRLPRREDDLDPAERRSEAGWIAGTIEYHGGVAPVSLVEEVLDLHAAYLSLQRPPALSSSSGPPPLPPAAHVPPPGYAPPGYAPPPAPPRSR